MVPVGKYGRINVKDLARYLKNKTSRYTSIVICLLNKNRHSRVLMLLTQVFEDRCINQNQQKYTFDRIVFVVDTC